MESKINSQPRAASKLESPRHAHPTPDSQPNIEEDTDKRMNTQSNDASNHKTNAFDESNAAKQLPNLTSHSLSPAIVEALKVLSKSTLNSDGKPEHGINCDKLTASLKQLRMRRNLHLFEKFDEVRRDFSGLNDKLNQMEESIESLKQITNSLHLPP